MKNIPAFFFFLGSLLANVAHAESACVHESNVICRVQVIPNTSSGVCQNVGLYTTDLTTGQTIQLATARECSRDEQVESMMAFANQLKADGVCRSIINTAK